MAATERIKGLCFLSFTLLYYYCIFSPLSIENDINFLKFTRLVMMLVGTVQVKDYRVEGGSELFACNWKHLTFSLGVGRRCQESALWGVKTVQLCCSAPKHMLPPPLFWHTPNWPFHSLTQKFPELNFHWAHLFPFLWFVECLLADWVQASKYHLGASLVFTLSLWLDGIKSD